MEDKKIEFKLIKMFNEHQSKRGPVRLQIVQWGKYPPVLEKREYWYDEEEQEKTGKAKGLKEEDVDIIVKNAEEIKSLLKVQQ